MRDGRKMRCSVMGHSALPTPADVCLSEGAIACQPEHSSQPWSAVDLLFVDLTKKNMYFKNCSRVFQIFFQLVFSCQVTGGF